MARYFEFIKNGQAHVFSGEEPRDAALKAATRFGQNGSVEVEIELREHGKRNKDGTYSLHKFRIGYVEKEAPEDAPEWLGSTVKEPMAEKIGVTRVKHMPGEESSFSRSSPSAERVGRFPSSQARM